MSKKFTEYSQLNLSEINKEVLKKWDENDVFSKSMTPFNDKVSVSQKIKSSEERARLKQLLQSIKPKNFGANQLCSSLHCSNHQRCWKRSSFRCYVRNAC